MSEDCLNSHCVSECGDYEECCCGTCYGFERHYCCDCEICPEGQRCCDDKTCYDPNKKKCCDYGTGQTCEKYKECCDGECCDEDITCCDGTCCEPNEYCCDGTCCPNHKCCVDGQCLKFGCMPSLDLVKSGECDCWAFECEGSITETFVWYCEEYGSGCPSGTECKQTGTIYCFTSRTRDCIGECLAYGSECELSYFEYAPKAPRCLCGCCP